MSNKSVTISIIVKDGDSIKNSLSRELPMFVADYLMTEAIDWENRWMITPSDYNEYLKSKESTKPS